jgi:prophage DNA circulation protein
MSTIFDANPSAVWRQELMPAYFRTARFHCDSNARESGRRIVEHEFPKKDYPYAEDMGRHFREFTIRGYLIVFPGPTQQALQLRPETWRTSDALFATDYRIPRKALIDALEAEGPGDLQLPTQLVQNVVCTRYRMTEEEKFGGYCTFDMTFQEYGVDPLLMVAPPNTAAVLAGIAAQLRSGILRKLQPPDPSIGTGEPTSSTGTSTTIST